MIAHLDKDQVAAGEHKQYDPVRYHFEWNSNHTECDVYALNWWDDASYAAYQGDPYHPED
jgi:hypothetical protein